MYCIYFHHCRSKLCGLYLKDEIQDLMCKFNNLSPSTLSSLKHLLLLTTSPPHLTPWPQKWDSSLTVLSLFLSVTEYFMHMPPLLAQNGSHPVLSHASSISVVLGEFCPNSSLKVYTSGWKQGTGRP